jgi:predicted DNA-binding transcriptional regulator AlpA
MSRLLNPDEASEKTGMTRRWLLDAARRDAVPHVRLGRFVMFDDEVLENWWRKKSRGPGR